MSVKIEVWGEYACFTRPETKTERMSYEAITPSAARGIIESIYWKPEIRWIIDEIHVLAPVRWMNVRRNEVAAKGATATPIYIEEQRQQRNTLLLRDVRYGIVAHFEVLPSHLENKDKHENTPEKHLAMFTRRAERGQHFQQPYLGCREFVAHYKLSSKGFSQSRLPASQRNRDLGWMLYDLAWPEMQSLTFHAQLVDGVMTVPALRVQLAR
jgi:CRISPR-associated protein Cas5d